MEAAFLPHSQEATSRGVILASDMPVPELGFGAKRASVARSAVELDLVGAGLGDQPGGVRET